MKHNLIAPSHCLVISENKKKVGSVEMAYWLTSLANIAEDISSFSSIHASSSQPPENLVARIQSPLLVFMGNHTHVTYIPRHTFT